MTTPARRQGPTSEATAPEKRDAEAGRTVELDFKAYASDPLGCLLFGRLALTPLGVAALSLIAALSFVALAALVNTASGSAERFNDSFGRAGWPGAVFIIGMLPLMGAFYAWVTRRSGQLIGRLHGQGVFEADAQSFRKRITGPDGFACLRHSSNVWGRLSVVIIILTLVLWLAVPQIDDPSPRPEWIFNLVMLPPILLAWYMICMLVARQVATMQILWRVFGKERVRLRPLHPDKAGGLSPMTQYIMTFGYFIAMVGFGVAFLIIQAYVVYGLADDFLVFAAIAAYVLLAPTIFFGTLGAAHRAMQEEKTRWLKHISSRFDHEFRYTLRWLSHDPEDLTAKVERISQLKSLHQLTSGFPVWPFDTGTIRRFGAVLSAPVVTLAVSLLADAFLLD